MASWRWLLVGTVLLLAGPLEAGWEEGVAAFRRGDFGTAASHFSELVERSPNAHAALFMLGQCQERLGETAASISTLRRALELEPDSARYAVALGRSLLADGQEAEAWETLERLDPTLMEPSFRTPRALIMASAALRLERPDDALRAIEGSAEDVGANPALSKARATACHRLGRDAEAAVAWARCFELDTDDLESGRYAVRAALAAADDPDSAETRSGLRDLAVEVSETLVDRDPSVEHLTLAGEADLRAGNGERAISRLERALPQAPDDPRILSLLRESLAAAGSGGDGSGCLEAALETTMDDGLRRRIHSQLARLAECRLELEAAVRHHTLAGETERAAAIAESAEPFRAALARRAQLQGTIAGLRGTLPDLERIDDAAGVEAIRRQISGLEQELASIDANLSEVRRALTSSCPGD
jgi:Flp pilus assembly protein TadD